MLFGKTIEKKEQASLQEQQPLKDKLHSNEGQSPGPF